MEQILLQTQQFSLQFNNTMIGRNSWLYNGTNTFKGYISNLRICKGQQFINQTFAPTRELDVHPGPDDDRTVLLACYDGENIFADKTGRHIIQHMVIVQVLQHPQLIVPLVLQQKIQD